MKLTTGIAVLFLVAASAAAQTGVLQQQPPEPAPVATSSDAPIGPRDVLDIKVFQDPALNTRATVTDDGKISMPLIGKLDVNGLRPVQLEQVISQALNKYLQKADVTVLVLEAGNRPISVIGAVTHPGRIIATGNITLMQALADAGGPTDRAASRCVIKRKGNGKETSIVVDYKKILNGKAPDVPLQDDDTIYVRESTF